MTGYVRKDTTNNIADGNVINAADLDAEFDGVQDAFNASTGHNHDGTTGEGAPITALGPTQDVTISAILLAPKTTNTVDIGSSSLRYKDLFLAGNGSIGGALAVTGVATLTAQPILSSLTASRAVFTDGSKGLVSNAITGTGNVVMSASPTLTGTIDAAAATLSGNLTLSGGTANGVTYLNGSKVVTSGSALTFDGTNFGIGAATALKPLDISFAGTSGARRFLASYDDSVITIKGANASNDPEAIRITGDNIRFNTGTSGSGSEGMRLTSTGLGIGTSSPAYKLDVNGQARLGGSTGLVFGVGTAFAGGQAEIYSTSTTPMGLGTTGAAVLRLYTNSTLQATLDSSGNLGLGVTPSAWTTFKVMQLGNFGAIGGVDSTSMNMFANTFYDGAFKYINTSSASRYRMDDGHSWFTAPSGTAGNAITFTQAMTLDASGRLGIGTTSPAARLDVSGGSIRVNEDGVGTKILTIRSDWAGVAPAINVTTNDPLIFLTNNTERARIDTSGNLGIGTTSIPTVGSTTVLAVGNANGGTHAIVQSGSIVYRTSASTSSVDFYTGNAVPLIFYTSGAERARITSSGNFGIGETSPSNRLVVGSVSDASNFLRINSSTVQTVFGSDANGGYVGTDNSYALRFFTNNTERARINSSGNLVVGSTSSSFNERIASIHDSSYTFGSYRGGTGSEGHFIFVNANGAVGSIFTNGSATAYNTSSDYRLKNITGALTGYKERLMSLQPKQGTWIADGSEFRGFLAHEFANPYRASVTGEKDAVDESGNPIYQGMQASSSEVMADLVALVKEQQAIIESLKARLDAANL